MFSGDVSEADAAAAALEAEHPDLVVMHRFRSAVKGFSFHLGPSASEQAVVSRLKRFAGLAAVEADAVVRSTATSVASGETVPVNVRRAAGVWNDGTSDQVQGAATVRVAVLDTGVAAHPDLNVVGGYCCTDCGSTTGGGSGPGKKGRRHQLRRLQSHRPNHGSTTTASPPPPPTSSGNESPAPSSSPPPPPPLSSGVWDDKYGHGTHVAGVLGARNSGSGVVGVAPGTGIWAIKVLSSTGAGSYSTVICGLDETVRRAADSDVKVASLSLTGTGYSSTLHAAVQSATAAGVLVVAAAGNDGVDMVDTYPAAFPEVLAVTAVADYDGKPSSTDPCSSEPPASFSNWVAAGADKAATTIAAPGVDVFSTHLNGGYATMSGTSQATPAVSAAAALCYSAGGACVGLAPAQAIAKIKAVAAAHPERRWSNDPTCNAANPRYYGEMVYAGTGTTGSTSVLA